MEMYNPKSLSSNINLLVKKVFWISLKLNIWKPKHFFFFNQTNVGWKSIQSIKYLAPVFLSNIRVCLELHYLVGVRHETCKSSIILKINHQRKNCSRIQTYQKKNTNKDFICSCTDILNEWLFLPKARDVLMRLAMCFCMGMHSPVIPRWYIIPVWLDTNWLSNRTFCLTKRNKHLYHFFK